MMRLFEARCVPHHKVCMYVCLCPVLYSTFPIYGVNNEHTALPRRFNRRSAMLNKKRHLPDILSHLTASFRIEPTLSSEFLRSLTRVKLPPFCRAFSLIGHVSHSYSKIRIQFSPTSKTNLRLIHVRTY